MLQAQCHHLGTSLTLQQQQQQHKYVVSTTRSTFETKHHRPASTTVVSTHQPCTVLSTSQQPVTSVTSDSTSQPPLFPVPFRRSSFRIDDILGEERTTRGDVSGRLPNVSTRNRDKCQSSTPTDHQTLRQNSDREEVTERPLTDDVSRRHRLHHHQQQQQQQLQQQQQHGGPEVDQRVGYIDEVENRQSSSSPVAKRHRDSTPGLSFRSHHVTSGSQSWGNRAPTHRDALARPPAISGIRSIPQGKSGSESDLVHPSMLLHNATSASHPVYLTSHHHHPQQQQQYGQLAEDAAGAVFASHHPLLAVPTSSSSSLISTVSFHPLQPIFTGRHGAFLCGCEFSCFVYFNTILNYPIM